MAKILLDNMIPQRLAHYDAKRITEKIRTQYRQVVSPNTIIERINGIIGGTTDGHLDGDQEKLKLLVGGNMDVLRFPADFAFRSVGVVSKVPNFNPGHFSQWVKIILAAKSRADLIDGEIRLPGSRKRRRAGLNVEAIRQQGESVKREHRDWLRGVIAGNLPFVSPGEWVKSIAKQLEVILSLRQIELLTYSLSAAYEYQKKTFETARANAGTYNVNEHDGDWHDNQLLYYLSDDSLYILTDEENIRKKSAASGQSSRVILLKEF